MQYDLNQIADPKRFQRLINTFLIERFGEDVRLTPIQGADGGSDGETAPDNPYIEFTHSGDEPSPSKPYHTTPRAGRYLFQTKYHSTGDQRLSELRTLVVSEFEKELSENVLARRDREDVTYFFLVTNVFASKDSIAKVDKIRKRLLGRRQTLHADVWWGERIVAHLDGSPKIWLAFPEIFPSSAPPMLAQALSESSTGVAQAFRLAAIDQYDRDRIIKFRQIELEESLFDLFVDLDAEINIDADDSLSMTTLDELSERFGRRFEVSPIERLQNHRSSPSALELLIDDELSIRRILLEGGPGQGKSTITQMAAQIYRGKVVGRDGDASRNQNWSQVSNLRFPFRIELRPFSVWLSGSETGSLEGYIAETIERDSGGSSVTVEDVHEFVKHSSVLLLLDGLDEIGSDSLRDRVVDAIMATIRRFEDGLNVDLRVVLTTRPPAIAGRRDKLEGFSRVLLMPMKASGIDDYLDRWIGAQIRTPDDQVRIRRSFEARRGDPHVEALARNPMQLSVLLQFIYLEGEAFPDRRADLYREYFRIVINRDVEKSPDLADNRELVEELHAFLGFQLHGMTEIDQRGRSLNRDDIVDLARRWLAKGGHAPAVADDFFALGEERFGLIVARSGEGQETTYGFEVQPIQEYFAASYISEHLSDGKAHEIFEKLIHRNYWREVALFLAGLRRPNEKSDLVARARQADRDSERGWQQNGRGIVLQLLREGVLRQPGHVREDAINLVMDLLDMEKYRVQVTPEGLVDTIGLLGKEYPSDDLNKRVVGLVERSSESLDESATMVVHRVASVVLPEREYTRLILDYGGRDPNVRSLVRMGVPYNPKSSAVLRSVVEAKDYWAGVPVGTWARQLWRCVLQYGYVVDTECPAGMQSGLVVEFATDYRGPQGRDVPVIEIPSPEPFAIWVLLRNVHLLCRLRQSAIDRRSADESQRDEYMELREQAVLGKKVLDYRDLGEGVECCIEDLVEASGELLAALAAGEGGRVRRKTEAYIGAIVEHLRDAGISGWVACRCAVDMVERRGGMWPLPGGVKRIDELLELVGEFYGPSDSPWSFRNFPVRWQFNMPLAVRLKRGRAPVALTDIVSETVRGEIAGDEEKVCWWMRDIPVPGVLVKTTVESCREYLVDLLRFMGARSLVGFVGDKRLRVQDTRKILKICHETEDEDVLRGAGTVLMQAAIERVADPKVICKILSVAPRSPLVYHVLSNVGGAVAGRGRTKRGHGVPLASSVASLIVGRAQEFPSSVVIQAAAFMAETEAGDSRPLFEEFPSLAEEPC